MSYRVKVVNPAERVELIRKACAATDKHDEFDFFRDQPTSLPVVRLPLHVPVYRMENFRTFSDQAEHIAHDGLAADYFKKGQEKESVQQVQHEILAKLAAKGTSSVVPIIDVLKKEGQRERILITRAGVVVNGNRRLAAMRELGLDFVNCAVLPEDAQPEDILAIEATLQARPETRLDYDWIGEAELLTALLPVKGGNHDVLAKWLGWKPAEVRNALLALAEADLYLKDWAKAPGEYKRVADDGEQLFKDLPALLQGKSQQLQDASRAIAWALFDNRSRLEGRVYNYNIAIGKRAGDVLDRLTEEMGIGGGSKEDDAEGQEGFEVDLEGDVETPIGHQELINLLQDDQKGSDAVDALVEICVGIVESERDKRSGNAALKAVTVANAKLAEVDLTRADSKTYPGIQKQLETIKQRVAKLEEKLTVISAQLPGAPD